MLSLNVTEDLKSASFLTALGEKGKRATKESAEAMRGRSAGARSYSGEFHSPFVGAFKFLVLTVNLKDAQLHAPPGRRVSNAPAPMRPERKLMFSDSYISFCGRLSRA